MTYDSRPDFERGSITSRFATAHRREGEIKGQPYAAKADPQPKLF
jgi:hypothetical protein